MFTVLWYLCMSMTCPILVYPWPSRQENICTGDFRHHQFTINYIYHECASYSFSVNSVNILVQERCNSSTLAMEFRLSSTNQLTWILQWNYLSVTVVCLATGDLKFVFFFHSVATLHYGHAIMAQINNYIHDFLLWVIIYPHHNFGAKPPHITF